MAVFTADPGRRRVLSRTSKEHRGSYQNEAAYGSLFRERGKTLSMVVMAAFLSLNANKAQAQSCADFWKSENFHEAKRLSTDRLNNPTLRRFLTDTLVGASCDNDVLISMVSDMGWELVFGANVSEDLANGKPFEWDRKVIFCQPSQFPLSLLGKCGNAMEIVSSDGILLSIETRGSK